MSKPARNDITGDSIKTKAPSSAYRKGWDRIFLKRKQDHAELYEERAKIFKEHSKVGRVPAMGEGDRENLEDIKASQEHGKGGA